MDQLLMDQLLIDQLLMDQLLMGQLRTSLSWCFVLIYLMTFLQHQASLSVDWDVNIIT